MYKIIVVLVCLLLIAQVHNNQCTHSKIRGMASGIINLGLPTNPTAVASYTQSLADADLGLQAEVFHAFALAGFQSAAGQAYYSLVVDQVIFSNGNTLMNFTVDYESRASVSYRTIWSKVKLSWLVISTNFYSSQNPSNPNALGNLAWAGTYGISDLTGITDRALTVNAIFANQSAIAGLADDVCGYVNTSPPRFDLDCGPTRANSRFMVHAYIAGFRFNPNVTGGLHVIAASVLLGDGSSASAQLRSISEAHRSTDFSFNNLGPAANVPTGPRFTVKPFANQLTYLKVSIVITTIPDLSRYPRFSNGAPFVYSGVYMGYTLFNTPKALVQNANAAGFFASNNFAGITAATVANG